MLTKTEAIVLKNMKYGDTSKIVTFYTKEFGKIKGIAKGARTSKNKFGASLEPMSYSLLALYKKENRELHLISQCDAIKTFKNLSNSLDKISAGLEVIELVDKVVHEEEKNDSMFNLLLNVLNALNCGEQENIFSLAFKLQLAKIFGYSPTLNECGICKKDLLLNKIEEKYGFQLDKGTVCCNDCIVKSRKYTGKNNLIISSYVLESLRKLLVFKFNHIDENNDIVGSGNETDNLIRLYLEYHFEGIKRIKAKKYLSFIK